MIGTEGTERFAYTFFRWSDPSRHTNEKRVFSKPQDGERYVENVASRRFC